MSYVIQNFHNPALLFNMTPRLKFFFFLFNIKQFVIFFKINSMLKFFNFDFLILPHTIYLLHFKFLYLNNVFKMYNKLTLSFIADYSNNFVSSLIFHNLYNWRSLFIKNWNARSLLMLQDKKVFNCYVYSIKLTNFKINKKFYENIFFFF